MVIGSIKSGIASFGHTLYKAFTDPIVNLFTALFGKSHVEHFENEWEDERLKNALDQFEKLQVRPLFSCFTNYDSLVEEAAVEVREALKQLAAFAVSPKVQRGAGQCDEIRHSIFQPKVKYIERAISAARATRNAQAKAEIKAGLSRLQAYRGSIDKIGNLYHPTRQAFYELSGLETLYQEQKRLEEEAGHVRMLADVSAAWLTERLEQNPGLALEIKRSEAELQKEERTAVVTGMVKALKQAKQHIQIEGQAADQFVPMITETFASLNEQLGKGPLLLLADELAVKTWDIIQLRDFYTSLGIQVPALNNLSIDILELSESREVIAQEQRLRLYTNLKTQIPELSTITLDSLEDPVNLKKIADLLEQRLRTIADKIGEKPSLINEAREIRRCFNEELLPRLRNQVNEKDHLEHVRYLRTIVERIFPPTLFERAANWVWGV